MGAADFGPRCGPPSECGCWSRRGLEGRSVVPFGLVVGRAVRLGRLPRRGADTARRGGAPAVELEALRLETAADLGGVAESGATDRAVGLQDAVGAVRAFADEALVEGAGVLVGAAGRSGEVAVAHPVPGRDVGDEVAE